MTNFYLSYPASVNSAVAGNYIDGLEDGGLNWRVGKVLHTLHIRRVSSGASILGINQHLPFYRKKGSQAEYNENVKRIDASSTDVIHRPPSK